VTLFRKIYSRWLRAWFLTQGITIAPTALLGRGVVIERGIHGNQKGVIVIDHGCELTAGGCLHAWGGKIHLGPRTYVGPYSVIYGHGGVDVGEDTLISMHCRILSSNHTVPPKGVNIRSQPDELRPTWIGRDVWLGAGVTVLGGVRIGEGCVIGAGAVVAHSLPAFSIAVGVPAKIINTRK
jgi:acetyltransferase-like isoleucine patch superfamily enzyme